jgi:hypothetical protein
LLRRHAHYPEPAEAPAAPGRRPTLTRDGRVAAAIALERATREGERSDDGDDELAEILGGG